MRLPIVRYVAYANPHTFEFWGGAKQFVAQLSFAELAEVFEYLSEITEAHDWSETDINDFFWFEQDWICTFLNTTEEEIWSR